MTTILEQLKKNRKKRYLKNCVLFDSLVTKNINTQT